jgi:serine protease AprX
MAEWRAGIVVVASGGNTGPESITVGVPGNVPYIITVGAMTDNYTPDDPTDDYLASFSSAGPTVEGFVKPDMLAPGGHVRGLMASARPAAYHDGNGDLFYTVFQQGAGLVNAYDAVHSNIAGSANRGLDIDADLAGTAHFGGPTATFGATVIFGPMVIFGPTAICGATVIFGRTP